MNPDNRHVEDGMGFAGLVSPEEGYLNVIEKRLARCIEKLNAEREKNTALRAENERLREALNAAIGHMMNALITLEAGGTKRQSADTLRRALARARAALEDSEV